ncbi:hypothetical protein BDB00DRAFT_874200 [Zychaea mexicana]|uniref:uncharacterized protein n=1 Tax=Zychaea mexicana TaxID=64656 RepID=UPI0022FE5660|nr:uncharacterized protein BDB00DRAFT_874200 [Zychaea mexicana]KAI9491638.1 hypothetical protein BDB00DRAFT_874200 [Zychaea mexicana]
MPNRLAQVLNYLLNALNTKVPSSLKTAKWSIQSKHLIIFELSQDHLKDTVVSQDGIVLKYSFVALLFWSSHPPIAVATTVNLNDVDVAKATWGAIWSRYHMWLHTCGGCPTVAVASGLYASLHVNDSSLVNVLALRASGYPVKGWVATYEIGANVAAVTSVVACGIHFYAYYTTKEFTGAVSWMGDAVWPCFRTRL